MRPKKNLDKDLNGKMGLYFAIGLALILALIYMALEWKTEEDNKGYDVGSNPKKEFRVKDASIILETKATKKPSTEG